MYETHSKNNCCLRPTDANDPEVVKQTGVFHETQAWTKQVRFYTAKIYTVTLQLFLHLI